LSGTKKGSWYFLGSGVFSKVIGRREAFMDIIRMPIHPHTTNKLT
jgi:hypothetical protein